MGTKHPDTVQWLSAGVGAAIGNLSKDVLTSTMVSLNAAKWNYLGFDLTTEPLLKRTLKKMMVKLLLIRNGTS